jgi:hypothetical protein
MRLDLDAANVIAQGKTEQDVVGTANEGGSVRAIYRHSNYDTRVAVASGGGTATVTNPGAGSNQTAGQSSATRRPATSTSAAARRRSMLGLRPS